MILGDSVKEPRDLQRGGTEKKQCDNIINYSSDISHYLLEHNRAKVQKREIMIDLINYVTLSFDSYNIIKNKEKLISFIDELNYEKYHRLITEKILNNINENVKILY